MESVVIMIQYATQVQAAKIAHLAITYSQLHQPIMENVLSAPTYLIVIVAILPIQIIAYYVKMAIM